MRKNNNTAHSMTKFTCDKNYRSMSNRHLCIFYNLCFTIDNYS